LRIGIVSDIHCNAAGLLAALKGMGDVDALICSGDTVYQYRFSNEVLAILRRSGAHLVLGNHDAVVLSRDGERVRESGNATEENLEFLRQAPTELRLTLDGKRIYVVHGSPWAPIKEYLFTTSPNFRRLAEVDADYVITGHTHFPVVQRVGTLLAINSGSCGEARDPSYQHQLTYAVLDTRLDHAEIFTIADPDQTRPLEEAPAGDSTPESLSEEASSVD